MTALDQAFIRAYAQPGAVAASTAPAAAMRSSVLAALEQPLRTGGAAAPATGGFPVMHKQHPGVAIPGIVADSPPGPQSRGVEQEVADMPVKPEPIALRPAWQVDEFAWPRACRRLIARAAEELDRLTDALLAISARGQKVLALGGWYRGEGATTLLLCAARRLVERGIKPVLVDADVRRPRLAKRLGLQPQCGWAEVTPEGTPLDQAIVESTANNIAVLPFREPPAEPDPPAADYTRLSGCIELLRDHYDMVLVDLGPLENIVVRDGLSPGGSLRGVDAVVLVRDHRTTSEERLGEIQRQLAEAGIALAGIIENFVAD